MEDVKRILVISRMTKYCKKAVHYGVSLAKKYEAELYVIHVIHNPFGYEGCKDRGSRVAGGKKGIGNERPV